MGRPSRLERGPDVVALSRENRFVGEAFPAFLRDELIPHPPSSRAGFREAGPPPDNGESNICSLLVVDAPGQRLRQDGLIVVGCASPCYFE